MSIVTIFEAVPSRVRATLRLVGEIGPASRDEVIASLMPGTDRADMAAKCINETVNLGLIERDGGELRLAKGITAKDVSDTQIDTFMLTWCDRVLAEQAAAAHAPNSKVARAIAWFLCQSPMTPWPWNQHHKETWRHGVKDADADYDLATASRFANLFYWARYLGYASAMNSGGLAAIPNPKNAIARHLKTLFRKDKRLPIVEFEKRLGAAIPVLETGTVRSEIEARLKRPREPHQFSLSSSLALLHLEAAHTIRLESLAEAERRVLLAFKSDPRQITHIALLPGDEK